MIVHILQVQKFAFIINISDNYSAAIFPKRKKDKKPIFLDFVNNLKSTLSLSL